MTSHHQAIEEQITTYLKDTFSPIAIVLHGSRACGMAQEHSDWDIVLFMSQKNSAVGRDIVHGANIELKQIVYPLAPQEFLGYFFRTENTKVLYDPQGIVPEILASHDTKIQEGNNFDERDLKARYAFLKSSIDGMRDYTNHPMICFDKKIDFYTRVTGAWFRFVKKEYEPSHYRAFPYMQKEDPEFFALLQKFVAETDGLKLVELGERMVERLFADKIHQQL